MESSFFRVCVCVYVQMQKRDMQSTHLQFCSLQIFNLSSSQRRSLYLSVILLKNGHICITTNRLWIIICIRNRIHFPRHLWFDKKSNWWQEVPVFSSFGWVPFVKVFTESLKQAERFRDASMLVINLWNVCKQTWSDGNRHRTIVSVTSAQFMLVHNVFGLTQFAWPPKNSRHPRTNEPNR